MDAEPPLQNKQDNICDSPLNIGHSRRYIGDKSIRLHQRDIRRRISQIGYPCMRHHLGGLPILSLHGSDGIFD